MVGMATQESGTEALLTRDIRAALPLAMLDLLEELTSTMFCVKDVQGRYVAVNATFVHRTNERSPRQVIGRTAPELFLPELAERYVEQDTRVIATGRALRGELELIVPPGGSPRWYLTGKVALRAPGDPAEGDARVVGLASLSQEVGHDAADDPAMHALNRVTAHIAAHLEETIRVADLAEVAGSSIDTLERRVRRVFHRSPGQLILTARIDRARHLLTDTDTPLADIATSCGFYDQAAFSRTFARLTGQTPARFRRAARHTDQRT